MSEKTKEIISSIFGYLIIIFTCVLYVLTAIFALNPTGKTLWQIIGDGIIVFCMGITMDHLFSIQGIVNGMKSKIVNSTMILYGTTVEKINSYINKLGEWCHKKNKKTYKEQRTKILSRAGLRYEDCFNEGGIAKPFVSTLVEKPIFFDKKNCKDRVALKNEKIRIKSLKRENKEAKNEDKFKRKCYWKAVKLKLTELYPNDLTSESGKKDDPNNLGPTINDYMTVTSIKTWITKIFFAVVLGVYGISLIKEFSWIELLWRAFQICLFAVFGIVKMRKSTMFITNDYRGRIIKKIDNLDEFYADLKVTVQANELIVQENEFKGETENGANNTTESVSSKL